MCLVRDRFAHFQERVRFCTLKPLHGSSRTQEHNKSCFMNMTNSYSLVAAVSFCNSTQLFRRLSHVPFFGSSWSSDTVLQVTCIVRLTHASKSIPFICCLSFFSRFMFWGFCSSLSPTQFFIFVPLWFMHLFMVVIQVYIFSLTHTILAQEDIHLGLCFPIALFCLHRDCFAWEYKGKTKVRVGVDGSMWVMRRWMSTGGRVGQYATGWSLHCLLLLLKRGKFHEDNPEREEQRVAKWVQVLQTRP